MYVLQPISAIQQPPAVINPHFPCVCKESSVLVERLEVSESVDCGVSRKQFNKPNFQAKFNNQMVLQHFLFINPTFFISSAFPFF